MAAPRGSGAGTEAARQEGLGFAELDGAEGRRELPDAGPAAARKPGFLRTLGPHAVRHMRRVYQLVAERYVPGETVADSSPDWSHIVAGPWLTKTLAGLRDPNQLAQLDPGDALKATLRPYQQVGVRWLHLLASRPSFEQFLRETDFLGTGKQQLFRLLELFLLQFVELVRHVMRP